MHQAIQDNQHFIGYLFNLVAGGLYALSLLTKLSYQFWNIVIWFVLIPATSIYLIGKKTTAWINLLSVPLVVYIFFKHTWNKWFDQAVVLLYDIGKIFHTDYKATSVYVCVVFPILLYFILFGFFTSRKTLRNYTLSIVVFTILTIIMFPISNKIIRNLYGSSDQPQVSYKHSSNNV